MHQRSNSIAGLYYVVYAAEPNVLSTIETNLISPTRVLALQLEEQIVHHEDPYHLKPYVTACLFFRPEAYEPGFAPLGSAEEATLLAAQFGLNYVEPAVIQQLRPLRHAPTSMLDILLALSAEDHIERPPGVLEKVLAHYPMPPQRRRELHRIKNEGRALIGSSHDLNM